MKMSSSEFDIRQSSVINLYIVSTPARGEYEENINFVWLSVFSF